MESIEDLIRVAGSRAMILVEKEEDTEMVRLSLNDQWIMQGNYWDFHPYCGNPLIHAIREKTFEWRSYEGLVEAIQLVLPKETEMIIIRRPYSYAKEGGHINPVSEAEYSSL